MNPEPKRILLIEDDPGDVELTKELLERSKIKYNLKVVTDGALALDYLLRRGEFDDAPRPHLIILDLNLPKKDGRKVLTEIKTNIAIRVIPVVVLTTSKSWVDIENSYFYGANCYISKPVEFSDLARSIDALINFWFSVVELPLIPEVTKGGTNGTRTGKLLNLRLLLVEDDPGDAAYFQEIMQKDLENPAQIEIAPDMPSAIRLLSTTGFDLVLLDLGLPGSTGLHTFETILPYATNLPIIILTGLEDEKVALECIRNGAQHYLLKSELNLRTITRIIRYAIERKRIAVELQESLYQQSILRQDADLANKKKTDFLAVASHEIRSPLSAIIGFVELLDGKLKPGQIDDECWNYISIIKRNAQLLLTVINDLLDFSKIEAGKLSTERVDMTLSEMLQDLEETLGLRARGKNIALNIVTDSDVPYVIRSDPTRLRQILLNIIGNSIKFTQHGSVDVNVQLTDDQMLMFTVADTGLGMSPEDAQNIFEPYSQGSTSVTRKFGGTGLGLSISKELARALGGDIVLTQSTPGKGSTFTITIDPGESTKGPDLVSRIDKSGTPTGLQESGLQH